MGHYDSQREYDARLRAEKTKQEAIAEARRLGVPLMGDTHFPVLGVCARCAGAVRAVPNWACRRADCPHRPPR